MAELTVEQAGVFYKMAKMVQGLWDQYGEPTALLELNRCFASKLKRAGVSFEFWEGHEDTYNSFEILFLRSGKRLAAPKRAWIELGHEPRQMLLLRLESRLKGPGGKDLGHNPHLARIELSPTAFQSPSMEEFDK